MSAADRYPIAFVIVSSVFAAAGCATIDVRPRGLPKIASASNTEEGKRWLERAEAARGDLTEHQALRMVLRDAWRTQTGRTLASPWEQESQQVQVDLDLADENVRLSLLEGENAGEIWGLQQWVTYRISAEGEEQWDAVDNPDGTLWFWLPRLAFFALPLRALRGAPVVQFAGIQNRGFHDHAVVYVSWSETPDDTSEQYVVWIDAESEQVRFIDHTLRSVSSTLQTTVAFEDYREVDGFAVPHRVSELGSDGRAVHRITVDYASFLAELEERYFVPKPNLRAQRDAGL